MLILRGNLFIWLVLMQLHGGLYGTYQVERASIVVETDCHDTLLWTDIPGIDLGLFHHCHFF